MRIYSVEAIPVSYPEPNDFDALRHLCLCKITTDDGLIGWGESITQFPEANLATKHVIEGMAEQLVGRDPRHTEALWRQNKDQAWWYGYGGGIASYAVSAIDIALWDIKGKAAGMSVLDLLGGPVHERLPAIASCHAHFSSIPAMVEEVQQWLSTGLQGVKTGFGKRGDANLGYQHDRDVEYVRAMRDGIGADKMLMIDNGISIKWDVTDAVRRLQAMEEYDLTWVEEPLGAWDPEGYATLRAKTTTRIAYGEKEWTVAGFERVLATGTVDVVGVDPGRAEGITGFKRVCDRIEAYRRQANAHAWSSAIVTAASLAI
jgi:L-alanine-DL-glutamate epimerase-like enolase superfamily enzyme